MPCNVGARRQMLSLSSLLQDVAGRPSPGSISSAEFLSHVVLRDVAVRNVIDGASSLCFVGLWDVAGCDSLAESIDLLLGGCIPS